MRTTNDERERRRRRTKLGLSLSRSPDALSLPRPWNKLVFVKGGKEMIILSDPSKIHPRSHPEWPQKCQGSSPLRRRFTVSAVFSCRGFPSASNFCKSGRPGRYKSPSTRNSERTAAISPEKASLGNLTWGKKFSLLVKKTLTFYMQ